jgi:hypothetical protein
MKLGEEMPMNFAIHVDKSFLSKDLISGIIVLSDGPARVLGQRGAIPGKLLKNMKDISVS